MEMPKVCVEIIKIPEDCKPYLLRLLRSYVLGIGVNIHSAHARTYRSLALYHRSVSATLSYSYGRHTMVPRLEGADTIDGSPIFAFERSAERELTGGAKWPIFYRRRPASDQTCTLRLSHF